MLKEIRTLVAHSAAPAAGPDPAAAANALFSEIAATEYRRHTMIYDDDDDESASRIADIEAEEEMRHAEVGAKLLEEQEAGVAAAVAAAKTQQKSLEHELEGVTVEEKKACARERYWGKGVSNRITDPWSTTHH